MEEKQITTIKDAQKLLKSFAERNDWKDVPNIVGSKVCSKVQP